MVKEFVCDGPNESYSKKQQIVLPINDFNITKHHSGYHINCLLSMHILIQYL